MYGKWFTTLFIYIFWTISMFITLDVQDSTDLVVCLKHHIRNGIFLQLHTKMPAM